ncbi:MAG: ABC transporter substrate-binding protein [Alphaproteobacteria bacterium]
MYDLNRMKALAAKGKVSRRDFVQFALASGMTVAAAETLFVKTVRAEPKKGGFCRVGLAHGSTTDTLDPGNYLDTSTQVPFSGSMSNQLTEVNEAGEIIPELAESYDASDDAATWVFHLRKGVTFHNGKDMTAEDVVASYRFHMTEDSKSAAKSVLAPVTDIKADGSDTVVFTLSAGSADFPFIASDYHIPIMPSADGVVDWQSGIRTGPFILENFNPGVSVKLKRNPNYFKEGRPYFDEFESLALTDVTARTNALTTGEIHWMARCDLKTLHLLERNADLEITEVTGYGHYVLPMLVDVPPFDDVNVRMALKHAIDRQEIVDKIFLGHATAGNDSPIPPPPSVPFAIDPQPRHSFDPDKAKSYLQKAGLSSLAVDLSVSDAAFEGAVDCGVLIKESAAKCGIDVNVVREPSDGYWDNVWRKKAWSASYWSGRPTIDWMFSTAYAADASWNETRWKHPRFNELLVQARAEQDQAKRAAMYAEMQQILHDDGGEVVLVFNNYVSANSRQLGHGKIGTNWEVDGYRLGERWWFV